MGRRPRASSAGATAFPPRSSRPAWFSAVFDELDQQRSRRTHFTVGIVDDVNHTSLRSTATSTSSPRPWSGALFYGLGSDGTVGANKNSIKIIGEETDKHAQGYFVYDSKKAGAVTVSHLRFGAPPIRSTYLIEQANFVACHQFEFLERIDMLEYAAAGRHLPAQQPLPGRTRSGTSCPARSSRRSSRRAFAFFVIDAYGVARDAGLGVRINTIMQTCFFAISGVLPEGRSDRARSRRPSRRPTASAATRRRAELRGGRRYARPPAVESTCRPRSTCDATADRRSSREDAPDFVRNGHRDDDRRQGTIFCPSAPSRSTAPSPPAPRKWEKRNIAHGDPDLGSGDLHPVQSSASWSAPTRRFAPRSMTGEALADAPGSFLSTELQSARPERPDLHPPGGAGRLHRLPSLRRGLPGQGQSEPAPQGHQHGAARRAPGSRAVQLRVLPRPAGDRSHAHHEDRRQGVAVPRAALRVSRAPAPAAARLPTSSC